MDQIEHLKERVRKVDTDYGTFANEAGVSLSWLSKFVNNRIPNPTIGSLNKVDAALQKRGM